MHPEEEEATAAEARIITRKKNMNLKCILSDDEYRENAKKQASLLEKNEDLEADKKSFNDRIKGKISTNDAELQILTRTIRDGYEFRDVECEVIEDYDLGLVKVIRLDTGEVEEERQMTESELAKRDELFFDQELEEENADAAEEDDDQDDDPEDFHNDTEDMLGIEDEEDEDDDK